MQTERIPLSSNRYTDWPWDAGDDCHDDEFDDVQKGLMSGILLESFWALYSAKLPGEVRKRSLTAKSLLQRSVLNGRMAFTSTPPTATSLPDGARSIIIPTWQTLPSGVHYNFLRRMLVGNKKLHRDFFLVFSKEEFLRIAEGKSVLFAVKASPSKDAIEDALEAIGISPDGVRPRVEMVKDVCGDVDPELFYFEWMAMVKRKINEILFPSNNEVR